MGAGRTRGKRLRAHANPLALSDIIPPSAPSEMDWSSHYPGWFPDPALTALHPPASSSSSSSTSSTATESSSSAGAAATGAGASPEVSIVDVGCGFGGLLTTLSPIFPDKLILGIEIRPAVVQIVEKSIRKFRADHAADAPSPKGHAAYSNISVLRSNIMKFMPNYFRRGQLEKMFFLFPDPHFKRTKYRLRVIGPLFCDYYAYAIREGGILYTITDVWDLHIWMKQHLDEHPLFERIPDADLKDDPCFHAIHHGTQEGQKVTRNHGDKWPAVYRRVAYRADRPGKVRAGAATAFLE